MARRTQQTTETPAAPAAPAKPAKPQEEKLLRTKDLAARFGVKPAFLRRFLRSLKQYQDGGYTRYGWRPNDPFLTTLAESLKKFKERESQRNKERLAKLKEGDGKKKKRSAPQQEQPPAEPAAEEAVEEIE